ncbi:hypothetical protein K435DRAFT_791392 [Dendrothele bispora CBS 962.96]|uniref:Uncharacterized protein n=1 Tax=Dendrothele bispora (strain CBS 962.96) TaxID=1314807 RepID=A0A4S8MLU8_DENBC|nr:hypothetical protein K435DRAFT_791392 [Dendrothele bispora CBS 962.96]
MANNYIPDPPVYRTLDKRSQIAFADPCREAHRKYTTLNVNQRPFHLIIVLVSKTRTVKDTHDTLKSDELSVLDSQTSLPDAPRRKYDRRRGSRNITDTAHQDQENLCNVDDASYQNIYTSITETVWNGLGSEVSEKRPHGPKLSQDKSAKQTC